MKSIEERAKLASEGYEDDGYSAGLYMGYIVGAKDQKAIDEEELLKLESVWVKEAQINHNDVANYKQGYYDAIDKACNIFCHTGCPHKTDSYNCLNDKCDTWKIFRRMMEE